MRGSITYNIIFWWKNSNFGIERYFFNFANVNIIAWCGSYHVDQWSILTKKSGNEKSQLLERVFFFNEIYIYVPILKKLKNVCKRTNIKFWGKYFGRPIYIYICDVHWKTELESIIFDMINKKYFILSYYIFTHYDYTIVVFLYVLFLGNCCFHSIFFNLICSYQ